MQHAVVECRSERYLRVDGKPPPPAWDAIAGVYKTRDGFVRLHTNFPHHRDAVCKVLNCKPERDAVQAALMQWDGEAFETAAYAGGCVVAFMRSHDQWSATPHAKALAGLPLLSIENPSQLRWAYPTYATFPAFLRAAGVATTVRDTRGREIDGACGQLAASEVTGAGAGGPAADAEVAQ